MRRFFHAAAFPFRGIGFVGAHRELVPWVVAPVVTSLLAAGLLLFGGIALGAKLVERWTGGHGVWATVVAAIVLVFVVVALGYVAFVALLSIVTAPFCSILSEKVEALARGRPPPSGGVVEGVRGIGHAIAQVAVYASVVVPLHLVGLVAAPAAPVAAVAGLYVTAHFLAYDAFEPPLSARRAGFGDKWRFVRAHRAESLGFGGMVALLMLVPVVNLLVPPFAAVGGALLFLEIEGAK